MLGSLRVSAPSLMSSSSSSTSLEGEHSVDASLLRFFLSSLMELVLMGLLVG